MSVFIPEREKHVFELSEPWCRTISSDYHIELVARLEKSKEVETFSGSLSWVGSMTKTLSPINVCPFTIWHISLNCVIRNEFQKFPTSYLGEEVILSNLWWFLMSLINSDPQVFKCLIVVYRTSNVFTVCQFLLSSALRLFYYTGFYYFHCHHLIDFDWFIIACHLQVSFVKLVTYPLVESIVFTCCKDP